MLVREHAFQLALTCIINTLNSLLIMNDLCILQEQVLYISVIQPINYNASTCLACLRLLYYLYIC